MENNEGKAAISFMSDDLVLKTTGKPRPQQQEQEQEQQPASPSKALNVNEAWVANREKDSSHNEAETAAVKSETTSASENIEDMETEEEQQQQDKLNDSSNSELATPLDITDEDLGASQAISEHSSADPDPNPSDPSGTNLNVNDTNSAANEQLETEQNLRPPTKEPAAVENKVTNRQKYIFKV